MIYKIQETKKHTRNQTCLMEDEMDASMSTTSCDSPP